MESEVLKKLGLIDNEIKVYLHLIRSGPSLASDIAKRVKLHRTHIYDLLDSLIKKTIVSYSTRENRKYFRASPPDQLQSLQNQRREELDEDAQKLNSLIGELTNLSALSKKDLSVSVYEGTSGFKTLFEDILRRKKEYLVLGYNPKQDNVFSKFMPGFSKRRKQLGIGRKAIVDPALKGTWLEEQKLQEIRFHKYNFPTGIIVYDTRVILTIIHESNQVAIVIDNNKTSDEFRKLFDNIWRISLK